MNQSTTLAHRHMKSNLGPHRGNAPATAPTPTPDPHSHAKVLLAVHSESINCYQQSPSGSPPCASLWGSVLLPPPPEWPKDGAVPAAPPLPGETHLLEPEQLHGEGQVRTRGSGGGHLLHKGTHGTGRGPTASAGAQTPSTKGALTLTARGVPVGSPHTRGAGSVYPRWLCRKGTPVTAMHVPCNTCAPKCGPWRG